MQNSELKFFRGLFLVSALWNLIGAVFGYFNTAYTFYSLFGRELTDPLYFTIYQGAWGTTLVYFIGYLIVAYDPIKHSGIVIVGLMGKIGFAISLLKFFVLGIAEPVVLVIIIGDFLFSIFFLLYFWRLYKSTYKIL